VAAVAAVVVSVAMLYRVDFPPRIASRGHTVGTASVLALVDTPRSLVVDLGEATRASVIRLLSDRASLLATLMTTSPIKDDIARGVGLDPNELITMRPSTLTDRRRRVPAPAVASVSIADPRAHVLHVAVNPLLEGDDPIIAVDTLAPDAAGAARLANQAIASLKQHLDREAQSRTVPAERRLVVRQLDPPEVSTFRRGPSTFLAEISGLLVFAFGCSAIVVAPRLKRRPSRRIRGLGVTG
jgi:hypothetical protein